ncbi:uncharacterized protein [Rutidosis leptorrhynchoides]|uniref:uncharacterized protein n=1 Tax=Rutidosis leptorrhynchoides TaxID=125765 RepID=UPI003A99178A
MSSSDEESLVNAMKSIFAYQNNVVIRREVEEQNEARSSRRKRRYIRRDRVEAHNRLMNDYFVQDPKYPLNISNGVIEYLHGNVYMREPTEDDIRRLYHKHEELHGFPEMLGSIDCIHWAWEKCPNAWKGHFTRGDHGYPTIMLEVVASYDNWIWHAYFGMAGSNNDLNVLNASPLFDSLLTDTAPQVPYEIGDIDFERGYYLADGIYPSGASLVKGFSSVVDAKRKYFTKKQYAARKDVERTFGILQGRWGILRQPARAYSVNKIKESCMVASYCTT